MSPSTKNLTPLLIATEEKTMAQRLSNPISALAGIAIAWILYSIFGPDTTANLTLAWIIALIVVPLLFFILQGKNNIALYEEGIYMRVGLRSWLYKWDSLKHFNTDKIKKRFQIKTKSLGSIMIYSREHFDEVEKILSEHITPKE